MKQELLRFQDIRYKAKGQEYGPLCIQLFEGELTGILTDDFFDKERLIDLFCGKIQNAPCPVHDDRIHLIRIFSFQPCTGRRCRVNHSIKLAFRK